MLLTIFLCSLVFGTMASEAQTSSSSNPLNVRVVAAEDDLDDVFKENPGRMFCSNVMYTSSYAPFQDNIVSAIKEAVLKNSDSFSNIGGLACEFKGGTPANRSVHRILVTFTVEADQQAFRQLRYISFESDDGVRLHADTEQENISYESVIEQESGPNARVAYMVLKKMPDNWTLEQIKAAFSAYTWRKAGFEQPWVAKMDKVSWFWHKNGVQRRMLISVITPQESEPKCEKLPPFLHQSLDRWPLSSLAAVCTTAIFACNQDTEVRFTTASERVPRLRRREVLLSKLMAVMQATRSVSC
jgi:hypothetical protein